LNEKPPNAPSPGSAGGLSGTTVASGMPAPMPKMCAMMPLTLVCGVVRSSHGASAVTNSAPFGCWLPVRML